MADPARSGDWAAETADRIESLVESIRGKTTLPLTTIARAIVYGLVAAVMGTVVLVLFAVGLVRFIDVYLPGNVWAAHLVVGLVFTLGGLFLWSKRGGAGE